MKRSIAEAISWEVVSTIASFGLAWFWFGNLGSCVAFSVVTAVLKVPLYCIHEGYWR